MFCQRLWYQYFEYILKTQVTVIFLFFKFWTNLYLRWNPPELKASLHILTNYLWFAMFPIHPRIRQKSITSEYKWVILRGWIRYTYPSNHEGRLITRHRVARFIHKSRALGPINTWAAATAVTDAAAASTDAVAALAASVHLENGNHVCPTLFHNQIWTIRTIQCIHNNKIPAYF